MQTKVKFLKKFEKALRRERVRVTEISIRNIQLYKS